MTHGPDWQQQRAFLIRIYFGAEDEKAGFTSRAYRDMSRTLHGLSKCRNKEELKAKATQALRNALTELHTSESVPTNPGDLAAVFDVWHRKARDRLIGAFRPFRSYHGQAQKWLNMTVKYRWFFAAGNELGDWHRVAHVPVDDYVLRAASKCRIPRCSKKSWSRWGPEEYEAFQNEIRVYAAKHHKTPLVVEHDWWMDQLVS